ncbi:MAG: hypothetical protein Q7S22_05970 [Candidatus Micrarchaeota archaeon]|nr:hypothetical protein [Candidatus Micrarchaeota archaeon]
MNDEQKGVGKMKKILPLLVIVLALGIGIWGAYNIFLLGMEIFGKCFPTICIDNKNSYDFAVLQPEYIAFNETYPSSIFTYGGDERNGIVIISNEKARLKFYLMSQGNIELGGIDLTCLNTGTTYTNGGTAKNETFVALIENRTCG